ncbi:MAG: two-component system, chemotaxis family, CheB/CheR fusion protein, partial [Clostridiales bacterium]|nr:two-component system, chemotaxis family, CheB/CheR fusion protein [Clostridiales bacterium]
MNTYYVALGASAGGLEAITRFFQTMPSDTGCIFFIIQHLSPDYKSLMNELLQNDTDMQIETMSDGMPLLPNHIYIAPPRKLISLSQGCVRMQEIKENKNIPHSIDYFFHSLAREYGKQAIGIVLSGTGNDGASGIVTMKQAGARTIAQQTHSAAFDAMPRHAIATGCVDWILSPEEMASEILTYTLYPNDYQKISMLLLEYSDIDFRKYKENTLKRRIERRMEITECKTTNDYWKQLIDSEYEKKALLKELLIGVTDFFRDKEAYDSLVQSV